MDKTKYILVQLLKKYFNKNECLHSCSYALNGKIVSIRSNSNECIQLAKEYVSDYFSINDNINFSHTDIYAYFVDELPDLFQIHNQWTKINLYLNATGYSMSGDTHLFFIPNKFLHFYDGKKHIVLLSYKFHDNIRVPFRLLREILISENPIPYLRMHAACAIYDNNAYVIIGPKNSGKSTLLCKLISSGASFCANDRVLLYQKADLINAFGIPVSIRLNKKMMASFHVFNDFSLSQTHFYDINKADMEKVEFIPKEYVSLFKTQIVNDVPVKAVIVPEYSKDKKLSFEYFQDKKRFIEDNTLMPDIAFPQYYCNKPIKINVDFIKEALISMTWIKISGNFYAKNKNSIIDCIKEMLNGQKTFCD